MFSYIVKDFQSIKEAKIQVDGITVIRGDSNAGKTATLRAITAACTNRFYSGCVRYGQSQASVAVKTDNDSRILQVIKPSDSSAKMKLGDEIFTKLSRTVPSQVSEFLDLGVIDSVGTEGYSLTFHPQFQPPLLLSMSHQKVIDLLSVNSALDDLKLVKDQLSLRSRELKSNIQLVDGMLSESQVKLNNLENEVTSLAPFIEQLNGLSTKLDEALSRNDRLNSLAQSLQSLSKIRARLSLQSRLVSNLNVALSKQQTFNQVSNLISIIDNLNQTDTSKLQTKVDVYSKIIALQTSLSDITSRFTKLGTLLDTTSKLQVTSHHILIYSKLPKTYPSVTKIDLLLSTYNQYTLSHKRLLELHDIVHNNLCPICKRPLDEETHNCS